MTQATPGTTIHVSAGTYSVTSAIWTGHDGTSALPIVLTVDGAVGTARLDIDAGEGLVINHAWWRVEKLWLNGVCAGGCDGSAGLHLKSTADEVIVRGLRISNFGQNIKGDRTPTDEILNGQILDSELYNDGADITAGGTAIDLVGGVGWRIARNYVHDFARDAVHYGIFVKGGARDAVIERNLVVGAKNRPHGSGAEVGISFGGGGTGPQFCAANNMGAQFCTCETFGGVARNNLVYDVNDSALHTKVACGSVFINNTVYASSPGLQVQIAGGMPVELRRNVLSGGVSGPATATDNLLNVSTATFNTLYRMPASFDFAAGTSPAAIRNVGTPVTNVTDDYFGRVRDQMPDWGAFELQASGGAVLPWSGTAGGGSAGGGSAGGGSTAGGSSAGGSTAGGSVSGGSTAGGSSAGTAGGSVSMDGGTGEPMVGSCGCTSFTWSPFVGAIVLAVRRRRAVRA